MGAVVGQNIAASLAPLVRSAAQALTLVESHET